MKCQDRSKWQGINDLLDSLATGESILIGHDWARVAEHAARNWRVHYGHTRYGTDNEIAILHSDDGLVIRRVSRPA